MVKKLKYFILLFLFVLTTTSAQGQTHDRFGVSAFANYSAPLAGLSEWFKPAVNFGFSFGKQAEMDWYFEGIVEYTNFEEENLSGHSAGKIDLSLEHLGMLFNAKYSLADAGFFKPYFNFGTGIYYWKGKRGEIQPDETVDPVIPYVAEKVLEEWNLGFRTGVGLDIELTDDIALDLVGYYRFIVGDLWPAMQPHVELENVSGFQTLNLAIHLRYYF
jgi:opacity protein-like surface antigen